MKVEILPSFVFEYHRLLSLVFLSKTSLLDCITYIIHPNRKKHNAFPSIIGKKSYNKRDIRADCYGILIFQKFSLIYFLILKTIITERRKSRYGGYQADRSDTFGSSRDILSVRRRITKKNQNKEKLKWQTRM